MTTGDDDRFGRRPLTVSEREGLLDLPLPGVFSSITSAGWVHSVPVHFLPIAGAFRIIAERDSVKTRNVLRTGRATLCVVATVGRERRYVSVEGSVLIDGRVAGGDLLALDRRYGTASADPDDGAYEGSITLVLRPDRWIAWADRHD